jgi:hypothetical protein
MHRSVRTFLLGKEDHVCVTPQKEFSAKGGECQILQVPRTEEIRIGSSEAESLAPWFDASEC